MEASGPPKPAMHVCDVSGSQVFAGVCLVNLSGAANGGAVMGASGSVSTERTPKYFAGFGRRAHDSAGAQSTPPHESGPLKDTLKPGLQTPGSHLENLFFHPGAISA